MKQEKTSEKWKYSAKDKAFVQTVTYDNTYTVAEAYELNRVAGLRIKRFRVLAKVWDAAKRGIEEALKDVEDEEMRKLYQAELDNINQNIEQAKKAVKELRDLKKQLKKYESQFKAYEKQVKETARKVQKELDKTLGKEEKR